MEEKQHHVKTGETTHSQPESIYLLKSFTCTQCEKFFFFNRAVFLMESTLNIIIITKKGLLLILNVLFNECL